MLQDSTELIACQSIWVIYLVFHTKNFYTLTNEIQQNKKHFTNIQEDGKNSENINNHKYPMYILPNVFIVYSLYLYEALLNMIDEIVY